MVHFSTLALVKLMASFGLISALPTLHQHTNNTASLARRRTCPELTELPMRLDPTSVPKRVKVTLIEASSTREWCSYSLDEDWDGKKAYARIAMPGLDEEGKKVYSDFLDIWRKLGKVITEVKVYGLYVVVMDAYEFQGKKIYETSAWRDFFGKDTRGPPPSDEYGKCSDMLKRIYDTVIEKATRYAEDKELKYKMSRFDFENSVRWSDDLQEMDFVNWKPSLVGDEPLPREYQSIQDENPIEGKIDLATRLWWRDLLTFSDIRIEEWPMPYFSRTTGELMDVRGWCLYFVHGRLKDDRGHPYVFNYERDDPAETHITPHFENE